MKIFFQNFLSFIKECVLLVLKISTGQVLWGWGMWVLVDICWESEAKSTGALIKGRVVGPRGLEVRGTQIASALPWTCRRPMAQRDRLSSTAVE